MLWFLLFTNIGVGVFILFLSLKKIANIPPQRWLQARWLRATTLVGALSLLLLQYNSQILYNKP